MANGKKAKLNEAVSEKNESLPPVQNLVKINSSKKTKKNSSNTAKTSNNDVEEEVKSKTPPEVNVQKVDGVQQKKEKPKKSKKEKIPTLIPLVDEDSDFIDETDGSVDEGKKCFEWMIDPCKAKTFFKDTFEKRPLHIKRGKRDYYKGVLSTKDFDNMLRDQSVLFGKNLDVTSYANGQRETHNPEGRAYGPGWKF